MSLPDPSLEPRVARPSQIPLPRESRPLLDPPFQPIPPAESPRPPALRGSRWHGSSRPPWWPEDEPWPPKKAERRGGFLRKVGCFFGVIFALMIVASALAALFSDGGGRHGDGGPSWGLLFVFLMIGGLFFVWRTVRHTAAPIADVMSAADRVADGDYAVRVESRANGEVGRLVE